jgi:cysteine-rich repeat protein
MRTSLHLSLRALLGASLLLACSDQGGIRVLAADGGRGVDAALPPASADTRPPASADASDGVVFVLDLRADVGTLDTLAERCGNGMFEPGEDCEDGNTVSGDGCSSRCKIEDGPPCPFPPCGLKEVCGNGKLTSMEICDDGNSVGGDGCSADCQAVETGFRCRAPGRRCAPICGDRMLRDGETCDDGNTLDGDGCSIYCLTEPGWDCASGTCVRVPAVDGGVDSGVVAPYCGDGIISAAEECDEGVANDDSTYGGCTSRCFFGPFCGDGMVNGPEEECDLATLNGAVYGKDGCTVGCTKTHYCGDGIVDVALREECDLGDRNGLKLDGNLNPSTAPEAMVYCTTDCEMPLCCVW